MTLSIYFLVSLGGLFTLGVVAVTFVVLVGLGVLRRRSRERVAAAVEQEPAAAVASTGNGIASPTSIKSVGTRQLAAVCRDCRQSLRQCRCTIVLYRHQDVDVVGGSPSSDLRHRALGASAGETATAADVGGYVVPVSTIQSNAVDHRHAVAAAAAAAAGGVGVHVVGPRMDQVELERRLTARLGVYSTRQWRPTKPATFNQYLYS